MTKKEIIITIVLLVVLIGGGIGGYTVWDHYHVWQVDQQQKKELSSTTPGANDITLQPQSSDTGGLKVDSGAQGAATNNNQAASASYTLAPTADELKKYETDYKTGQSSLYGDIQVGTGSEALATSNVAVVYKGWLTDGTVFDQSRTDDAGKLQAFSFTVGAHQVIAGMEESIIGMKVGGVRRMIIPPAAGYGAQAQGTIPANSLLVFNVQLVAVQ